MEIPRRYWENYIERLSRISATAGEQLQKWVDKNGFEDRTALIEYAYALVTKYGEATSELACQMYDAVAELEHVLKPAAEPAPTATYNETAKAINGVLKQSPSGQLLDQAVQRMVKQAGADTTLRNAIRDGAQFAWVPNGDTCPFCIALASRGWQYASKKAVKKGHAEHIHAHCDCQYAIKFGRDSSVAGYNPKVYEDMYYAQKGNAQSKINAMRRKDYAENKERINEQKRNAYAIRVGNKEL